MDSCVISRVMLWLHTSFCCKAPTSGRDMADSRSGDRDLAGEGPGSKGALLGTMRQAAAAIEDKARRHRRQQYLCIRGSSALNSLSHTEAFKLSVVRVNSARRLRRIYEEMDADHDGRINSTDLKTYLEESSRNLAKMATGIFNSYDRAGKGFMSFRSTGPLLLPAQSMAGLASPALQEQSLMPPIGLSEDAVPQRYPL
eukprot:jgi/Astpho2/3126/fgenesh1_pg.00051_%23_93_t